jgi:hypothetical protein
VPQLIELFISTIRRFDGSRAKVSRAHPGFGIIVGYFDQIFQLANDLFLFEEFGLQSPDHALLILSDFVCYEGCWVTTVVFGVDGVSGAYLEGWLMAPRITQRTVDDMGGGYVVVRGLTGVDWRWGSKRVGLSGAEGGLSTLTGCNIGRVLSGWLWVDVNILEGIFLGVSVIHIK